MKKELILIISFLIISYFLRFYRLSELAMFVGDQGRDYLAAKDMLLNRRLTLIGPQTSIRWLNLGPFFYYFLAFFLLLGKFNPVWPIYATAFFGVLATYLIFLLGKEFYSPKIGLIAGFIYAVSPFAVIQSRIALHTSIYPVFILLFLFFLDKFLKSAKNKKINLAGLLISFSIAIQLHLSAILLIPFALLVIESEKRPKKKLFLSIFLLFSFVLFLYKLYRRSPFTEISYWLKIIEEIFGFGYFWLTFLALGAMILGLVGLIGNPGKGERILKISLLVTVLGLTIKNSSAEHYFNLFLPFGILLFSLGLERAGSFVGGKVTVLVAVSVFLIINFFGLINSRFYSSFYGPTLSQRLELARFIVNDSPQKNPSLIRCSPLWDFASTNLNYEYLVWWLSLNKQEQTFEENKPVYYLYEPKEAWITREGCEQIDLSKGELFEFKQAFLLKSYLRND